MASLVREPIRTFSVAFEEREANELDHARQVARGIRAEHREVLVTPGEFFESLPKLIWHEDEPIAFPSSIPLFFVSRLAAEHVKVVLTGEGADELFLGYNRYRVTAWNAALGPLYEAVAPAPIVRAVRRVVGKLPGSAQRYLRRSFLSLPPGPRSLFCENFSVFPGAFRDELLAASPPGGRDPHAEALRAYAEARGGPLERMAHADRETYLVELLMKQDQMSMAASVESRVPFLDHPFAERAARIPGRFKLRRGQTKAVLRAAVADLVPPEILTRSKMGFPVPLGRWLQGPCWPIVEEFVLGARARRRGLFVPATLRRLAEEHRGRARNHAARLWLLVNLEIWQRMFIDGEDVAQLRVAG
jgi:asparagine synthase (glutamine-hydrolysing)